jgi:transposase-like protein
MTNGAWLVDETYVKMRNRQRHLNRAADSCRRTIDFPLDAKRSATAARHLFR